MTEVERPSLTLADVHAAARRLRDVAHVTPVVTSRTLDAAVGASVFIKCENLQRVGAFKFRGAYNAMAQLDVEQLARGVAAYSSGNHAQAVALAARLLGTKCVILMPEDTPETKLAATRGYGAEVATYDRYVGDRVRLGKELADSRGLALIPPYENVQIMAGQGTAALELLQEFSALDALVVPVGGGGLIAGSATAAKALCPGIRVIGVEPLDGDDTKRSIEAGHRVSIPVPRTIADGQAADIPGELTFAINRVLVDEVVLVSDDEIRSAMAFAFERLKMVIEPSGASALAAVMAQRIGSSLRRIGVIVSGGNIGPRRFCEILS
jgi:threonine dehydratase